MSVIISWGGAQHGQLGVGTVDNGKVEVPTVLSGLKNVDVGQIACGESHTLFVLRNGAIYTCGNNEYGQLGHSKRQHRPEQIDVLRNQVVCQAGAGACHSLVLTRAGEVFSWGDNSQGQLGRGQLDPDLCRQPKLIKHLVPHTVVQVTSGRNHCMALTDDGRVFSWGGNQHGQLGLGHTTDHSKVQFIACLRGIPVAQVVTGGSHSFILSVSGAVYGWGKNCFGQLGLNDEKDRSHPTLCKSLRYQKVKHMSCGEDHTSALTQDGGVFTFGFGAYGQLGHNSKNNEILPRKVMELMGSSVTQVACGRRHTLVYVAQSGRLYTFGSGSCGQLGTGEPGTKTKVCPVLVKGPFVPCSDNTRMETDGGPVFVVNRAAAGGDHCCVHAVEPESSCTRADYRVQNPEQQIRCLSLDTVNKFYSLAVGESLPVDVEEEITKVFSTASCLNASFLVSDHFGCNSKRHGLDMDAVRHSCTKISEVTNVHVIQKISQCIESMLIPSLPSSPPDVESLRLYLMLPELHLFEQLKYYSSLIDPFGKAILALDKTASRLLDMWWGTLSAPFFLRVVYIYKETIVYILGLTEPLNMQEMEMRFRALFVSLEVLKKLNNVNEQNGQIVAYHKFYISELKDKVNIKGDYVSWVQHQGLGKTTPGQRLLFCNYPFTFDAAAKSLLLQTDALMQMQSAIDEVQRRNIQALFLPIKPDSPCLIFYVSRESIVQDTIRQLMVQGPADLKKPLKVVFAGEEAMDEGGVRKEFFMLLLRELLDPKYGMFKHYESRLEWFAPMTFEEQQMYLLIGCLCGMAIYNSIIIQLNFPLVLYKKLLSRTPTLEDLNELMPTVGKSFEDLLDYEGDDVEDTFCITFEVTQEFFGDIKTVELVPGGSRKTVTKDNRKEFVDLYVSHVFTRAVEDQYNAFHKGFHKVCGGRVLELFHPRELRAMVIGNENYDFHEMEKNTEYKGEYHRYHATIKFFWDVFHDLSLTDKKNFLLFLTGSDKIPIIGMKYVKIVIQPMTSDERFLPVAHTCFNLLDLPKYTSKGALKDKLVQAIQQTEGFGLV